MIMYLQLHAGLEQMRKNADENSKLQYLIWQPNISLKFW